jgi:hypothetical protein
MQHRFRIGQTVFFSSRATNSSRAAFKIVRPMPVDNDERVRYQIKSVAEAFTRIAEEHDLSLS